MEMPFALTMTREDFRAWSASRQERWEWVDGLAFPLLRGFAGGSWQHAEVASRLLALLATRLPPPCRAIIGDLMRIATPASERYGDILVVCNPPSDRRTDVIDEIAAVVEIVSPNSRERDLVDKRREYLAIPGLECYVAVFESEPKAIVFTPQAPFGETVLDSIEIRGATVALSELFP